MSVRLSLMVVTAMAILLMASLAVMLHYSRKELKTEALQKASQTLEGTVQHIDNILLGVEQATGNMFFNLLPYLDNPDMMYVYARELVKSVPYIESCAIAFKPYFYKDRELFMAYIHRDNDSTLVQLETYADGPYTEQLWFSEPMATARPEWMLPLKDMSQVDPITTFSLPIPGIDGKPIGVIGVDVSLSMLSHIVLAAKPSPNSYCTLLDDEGAFIVHPDSVKLHQTVFTQLEKGADPTVKEVAEAMVKGQTGYKPFRMNGMDYYVFFKPFERMAVPGRTTEKLGWSVGIIYPEDDIFGDYKRLLYYVLAIAVAGLLLLFVLSRLIMHRQLRPLLMLAESAQRIADGNYDEPIPDSRQQDEIGQLQNDFQQMQQSLAAHVGELEQMKTTLEERGKGLRAAYEQVKKADRMKTAFLHNMTNQMVAPADAIVTDVGALCDRGSGISQEEANRLVSNIEQQGKVITELLNNLFDMSEQDTGKEAGHD